MLSITSPGYHGQSHPREHPHVQAIICFRNHAYPETLSLLKIIPAHDMNKSGAHSFGSVRARPTTGSRRRPRPLTPYHQGYVSVKKRIPSHVPNQLPLGELLLFSIIRLFRRMFTLVGYRHSPRTRMDVQCFFLRVSCRRPTPATLDARDEENLGSCPGVLGEGVTCSKRVMIRCRHCEQPDLGRAKCLISQSIKCRREDLQHPLFFSNNASLIL